ncbi:MAG: lipoyl synthase [Nitrospirae bacterium]|nr:lipoyl synthase [Nitrospirota bacterium]
MRLPDWIKTRGLSCQHNTKQILKKFKVNTVCENARCPNIGMCYSKPTATFMILGAKCTRNCSFCSVESSFPEPIDSDEPIRVALAAKEMGLKYIIITSVTRDDLLDGGSQHFANTVTAVKSIINNAKVEVLTPDFKGDISAIDTVMNSKPDVFGHNVETIPRLYPIVRPRADYNRSLNVLRYAKEISTDTNIKSGIMLGLGETFKEIIEVLKELKEVGCDFITIGQYLRPTKTNLPVVEYINPNIFEEIRIIAIEMGFKYVASAPLVRSSMNAEEMCMLGNKQNA